MRTLFRALLLVLLCATSGAVIARDLAFEERVKAQKAIEQVYRSHQIGATRPFEEAATREVIEGKVREYLEETAALREIWSVEVTAEMLEKETARLLRETRMPARLRELFAALEDDPFLVQECLARPVLVDRLARGFYARDRGLHAAAGRNADSIRALLRSGGLDPRTVHANRTLIELRPKESRRPPRAVSTAGAIRLDLDPEELAVWRHKLPVGGGISPVTEEADRFTILAPLEDEPDRLLVASYIVPKAPWDDWWRRVRRFSVQSNGRKVRSRNQCMGGDFHDGRPDGALGAHSPSGAAAGWSSGAGSTRTASRTQGAATILSPTRGRRQQPRTPRTADTATRRSGPASACSYGEASAALPSTPAAPTIRRRTYGSR